MLDMFSFMIFGSVEAMNNAAHVLEVIDATLDKLDGIEHADMIDKDGKAISLQNADIAFRDVTFSYDTVPVLRNISFSIPQGSTTAIIGPSGSGKTTICNLIAHFYDVDSGEVTVGGENVRNIDVYKRQGSLPVRIFPHFRYLLQVRLHRRKGFFADHMLDPAGIFGRSLFVHA